jgi:hypothetical protein
MHVSGDRLVAQRIATLDAEVPVKKCLQALFTYEMEKADEVAPRYTAEYEQVIGKCATEWDPATVEESKS